MTTFGQEMMMISKLDCRAVSVLLLWAVLTGCSRADVQDPLPLPKGETQDSAFRRLAPPEGWAKYQTQAFNLTSKTPSVLTGKIHYDPDFDKALDLLLPHDSTGDRTLRRNLMSGPADEATFWQAGEKRGVLYTLCQAHECSTTNLVVFYQPDSKVMTARLQVRCVVSWLGDITNAEKALITSEYPIDATDVNREHDCIP